MAMHLTTVPFYRLAVVFALLGAASPAKAESHGKKPIAFSGQVKSVDLKLQTVEIKHGPIPGYMPAMTMDYPIEDKALLRQLKPDDKITATVYVGDPMLHDVHVLSSKSSDEPHRDPRTARRCADTSRSPRIVCSRSSDPGGPEKRC
jgi:Cu/Ag efflux protein CusF